MCRTHYNQMRRKRKNFDDHPRKDELVRSTQSDEIKSLRFWQYVTPLDVTACWEWQGPVCRSTGYGIVNWQNKKIKAHRVSYELNVGQIPEGLLVMHSCDNRRCVNPAHLSCGTNLDNMHDAARKGRMAFQPTKLTPESVREIRRLYRTGNESYSSVARRFRVSWMMVRQVVKGYVWRWIQ